jgi:glycerol-3-phosphate acyltransferase PlsY
MEPAALTAAILSGYLLGSISFARLFTRWLAPAADLSTLSIPIQGTDEAVQADLYGANAASRVLGARYGIAVMLLDILKVALPTLTFKVLYADRPYLLVVALAGVVGHNWPVYHRLEGGRGFAAILGGLLVVDWLGALVLPVLSLLLGGVLLHNPFVAYVAWLWLLIPWLWLRTHDPAYLVYALALNLVFVLAIIPEIRLMLKLRREGRLQGYLQGLLQSSPRWRGMSRLTRRLRLFGRR